MCNAILEQLRDAEVEQSHFAFGGDENVRGLEVAMNDQLAVCVGDGVDDLQKQAQPSAQVERLAIVARAAMDVERPARDVFEREVRLAIVGEARIVESCDVRMIQRSEDRTLACHALCEAGVRNDMWQLERHRPIDQTVDPFREPHRAHAAAAELAHEAIGADRASALIRCGRCFERDARQRREEIAGLDLGGAREQRAQLRLEGVELRIQRVEPRGARGGRAVERFIEQPLEVGPRCDIEPQLRHRAPRCEHVLSSYGIAAHEPDIPRSPQVSICESTRRAFSQSRRTVRSVTPSASAISVSVSPAK